MNQNINSDVLIFFEYHDPSCNWTRHGVLKGTCKSGIKKSERAFNEEEADGRKKYHEADERTGSSEDGIFIDGTDPDGCGVCDFFPERHAR